jgi:hypothetical protein
LRTNGWHDHRRGPRNKRAPSVIVMKDVANPACPAPDQRRFLLQSRCDRAPRCHRSPPRHHRPERRGPARRAGRPPRAAPPEHRHRRGDRAARRRRRLGRARSRCALPAAAPGPACPGRRLRAAVLIMAKGYSHGAADIRADHACDRAQMIWFWAHPSGDVAAQTASGPSRARAARGLSILVRVVLSALVWRTSRLRR